MNQGLSDPKQTPKKCLPLQDLKFDVRLYPVLQEQVYDPSAFWQICSQAWSPLVHSSLSITNLKMIQACFVYIHINQPEQVSPSASSEYPSLHSQRKEPGVFIQVWLHPPLAVSHSLVSVNVNEYYIILHVLGVLNSVHLSSFEL